MNLSAYFDYLEEFATNHKEIGHTDNAKRFFRVDIEELDNAFRTRANYPLVAALNPIINSTAALSTNIRLNYQGSLLLLDQIKDKGDALERSTKENKLLAIATDFTTKLINDRRSYDIANKTFVLAGLDFGSFNLELVPDRYTSMCGVLLTFRFNDALPQFDISKWNNESKYTV
tara:strand:+ start:3741 stop:4262 length:522 start_codon:yes stop_codon:yes gene_type:complete